jgi:hypothetical protein
VRGRISTLAGDQGNEPVQWIGANGEPVATMFAVEGGGHWLTIDLPRPHAAGDVNLLDLQVDGDYSANVRLRLVTERGAGRAGTKVLVQVGNVEVFSIDSEGNIVVAGDIVAGGVVTAANLGGWTGTLRTDEIAAVTVSDGRIVAVA